MRKGNKTIIFLLIILVLVLGFLVLTIKKAQTARADFDFSFNPDVLYTIQGNSILPVSNPSFAAPAQKIKMMVTAYSSTIWETDDNPFVTASGEKVKDGIVANNLLPFGTEIRIPELYGNKIFVVEDRMNWKKSNYHVDIWLPDHFQAENFGAKITYVEILEN